MALKPRGVIALAAIVAATFAVTAGTLMAADPPAQAAVPKGQIKIVAVTAKAADPNMLEATLADGKTKVQYGTTGLDNVSIGVPVTLAAETVDPNVKATKYTWTLTTPTGSKSKLAANNEPTAKFTPDVPGIYKVDLVVANDAGASPMASVQIHAGEYIGTGAGDCFQCHSKTTQEWSETRHAEIFSREIDLGDSHYSETCIRCHNTGYTPGVKGNGGFTDVKAQVGWSFPTAEEIEAGKDKIWETVPTRLANMANIQCEACHGPAKDHVEKGSKTMATSLDNAVCAQCHDTSAKHIKGTEIQFSKHSEAESQAWTYPVGPSRQDCVRCHSGAGYVSFIKAPTEKASWDNSMQTVTCAVCHDPHSDTNKWQLRITGMPVAMAENITKDFGLSATCVECHNGRTTAADAQKGSYPHYSAAAEMLADTGGVTYGQTVPNSAHGMVVGQFPMKSPSDPSVDLFGGAKPGACVACHMLPNTLATSDPNKWKVGEHSFNMATADRSFQNTAACQTCHAGITDFNITAKADYDGNGKVEGVQEEVAGLVTLLQKAIADSGIRPIQGNPYFNRDDLAKADEKQKNAVYNYRFVRGLEGRDGADNAIHNFKRSVALLQLSYKDLTGADVPGATLMR